MAEDSTDSGMFRVRRSSSVWRPLREYFHELLALEAQVPGASGAEPHFLGVATYNLQHRPASAKIEAS
jgi:hypothetical protein